MSLIVRIMCEILARGCNLSSCVFTGGPAVSAAVT